MWWLFRLSTGNGGPGIQTGCQNFNHLSQVCCKADVRYCLLHGLWKSLKLGLYGVQVSVFRWLHWLKYNCQTSSNSSFFHRDKNDKSMGCGTAAPWSTHQCCLSFVHSFHDSLAWHQAIAKRSLNHKNNLATQPPNTRRQDPLFTGRGHIGRY